MKRVISLVCVVLGMQVFANESVSKTIGNVRWQFSVMTGWPKCCLQDTFYARVGHEDDFNRTYTAVPTGTAGDVVVPSGFSHTSYDNQKWYHVHGVERYAFKDCKLITSVRLPATIREIGSSAFENCIAMTNVLFEANTNKVSFGSRTFAGCTKLAEFEFPIHVYSFGHLMFTGCDSLASVGGIDESKYCYEDGILYNSNKTEVVEWLKDSRIVKVAEGVKTISGMKDSKIIEEIVLPESLQTIETFAISSNPELKRVTIRENVSSIGSYTFQATKLQVVVVDPGDTDRVKGLMAKSSLGVDGANALQYIEIPAAPVITPVEGSVFVGSMTVMITCPSEGASIFYTVDGTEPTASSNPYKKFKITGKTTVKAVAVKDGVPYSKVATATFALGRCDNPVISLADGTIFQHSNQRIEIAHGEEGVVHYTLDGSEPTLESMVYSEPFEISETTVVKAKVFSDRYFDSGIAVSRLTREWLKVSTPIVSAKSSFMGSRTTVELSCAMDGAVIRYTVNGTDPNPHSPKYVKPFDVTDSCTIKAYATCSDFMNSDTASFAITKQWGVGDSVGVPDLCFTSSGSAPWVRDVKVAHDGSESIRSGEIEDGERSVLETSVCGKGTISFCWRSSTEDSGGDYDWDHGEFHADGTVYYIEGESDWTKVTHTFVTDGEHTLSWIYIKDNYELWADDCIWMDSFVWMPEKTQLSEVKVPLVWLKEKYPSLGTYYYDYEEKAESDAANGMKVWACYVAGLDPTISTDQFKANITLTNNVPYITWSPSLNTNGEVRMYKVWGKARLEGEDDKWMYPTNDTHRFFKVSVEMP